MISEKDLERLSDGDAAVRPPAEVRRRGATYRRRRRALRTAVAAPLLVVAVVAVAAAVGPDTAEQRVEVAAPVDSLAVGGPANAVACTAFAELRDPEDAGVPRLLPEFLPAGVEVESAWARAELTSRRSCPAVPTALVAVRQAPGGAVDASIRLTGPSPVPYGQDAGPTYRTVAVRTDPRATLIRVPAVDPDFLQLQWVEPDGSVWSLTGYGVDLESLQEATAALVLRADGIGPVADLPGSPVGLEVVWQLEDLPGEPAAEEPYWHVVVDDGQSEEGSALSIDVSRPLAPTSAVASVVGPDARLLEVRGHPAVAATEPSGHSSLTWDEEPGVVVRLSGRFDLATLERIAASLLAVDADDPRIGR